MVPYVGTYGMVGTVGRYLRYLWYSILAVSNLFPLPRKFFEKDFHVASYF